VVSGTLSLSSRRAPARQSNRTSADSLFEKGMGGCEIRKTFMTPTLKLPLAFDTKDLQGDLANFSSSDWVPHFNIHYYEGDWSGIALRAPNNGRVDLFPDPEAKSFVDTPAIDKCPSVRAVLSKFECETQSVRFLRLLPGSKIRHHRDYELSLEDGLARVHIPVRTSTEVEFYLDDKRIEMNEGEAWYLNFNLYHSVENNGQDERIHLVIDCVVNDWFRSFFP